MSAATESLIHHVRPRLLDLFCGAGGASRGYHDAGFEVVGVEELIIDEFWDDLTEEAPEA